MNENKIAPRAPDDGSRLNIFSSADRSRIVFELHVRGKEGRITLEAPELEDFQRHIAVVRALLLEPVVPGIDIGARMSSIYAPAWEIRQPLSEAPLPAGKLLLLRHPGLGWLSFLLPPHEAKALGERLLAVSKEVPVETVQAEGPHSDTD